MTVKLLTEHNLGFLSLKGGCTCSPESTVATLLEFICHGAIMLFCLFCHMLTTDVPTKSDSDVICCLQLLSKTLTCILHLVSREPIDHLCINPILWIELMHK